MNSRPWRDPQLQKSGYLSQIWFRSRIGINTTYYGTNRIFDSSR